MVEAITDPAITIASRDKTAKEPPSAVHRHRSASSILFESLFELVL
jgi:hypothetical protein